MDLTGLDTGKVKSVNRGGYFNDINAGKYGISLNMKAPHGRELFKKLVAVSDVVVEAFTAETMQKWGLGYDTLKSHQAGYYLYAATPVGATQVPT